MNESIPPKAPNFQYEIENLVISTKDDQPAQEALKTLAHTILNHLTVQSSTSDLEPEEQVTLAQLENLFNNPSAQVVLKRLAQILNHRCPQPSADSQKLKPTLVPDLPDLPCVNCGAQAVVKLDNHYYKCQSCRTVTNFPPAKDNRLTVQSSTSDPQPDARECPQPSSDSQKLKPTLVPDPPDLPCVNCGAQAVVKLDNHYYKCQSCGIVAHSACREVAQPQQPSSSQKPRPRVYPLAPPPVCIKDCATVLLVEDHKGITKMLKERFEHKGFLVRSVFDADNGFRVYESSGPFVLVMVDFSLKDGGIEFAKTVRQNDPLQRIVITDFSCRTQEEVERKRLHELMDIPVLTDVWQLSKLLDSLRPWANREEVEQAIEKLKRSQADLCRIQKIARLKGWHDWEDLLDEVLLRALMGTTDPANGKCKGMHRWDKRIDFVTFVIGSMRGMNSHNKEKSRKLEPLDPAYDSASGEKRADERLLDEADLEEILQLFCDDPEARNVLLDLACGMGKQEIKSKRSLSNRQFAAIMKRIRSKLSGRSPDK